ncbi:hypothetical protein DASC09_039110 [Saccharomycopsis crataegensis]|uniref:C3H1-type domain-containing protein n=1 Tax=Saccharomycopsis crataegensis TaxID=43959 RepID=A0AAV5QPT4_9ASCO|nr:hypothetical protein DASC09_039110 [Saccharomycopsis crataegensis]
MSHNRSKVNCTFYEKIGACRHGEKCSRKHIKPRTSKTIMCPNLYQNPELNDALKSKLKKEQIDDLFNKFYEDLFIECSLLGAQVEDIVVCENANDHLNGNVYIKFATESSTDKILQNFNTRWYNDRPVYCELSPVRNFNQSVCKQHFMGKCDRGDMCNFMHSKRPSEGLFEGLYLSQAKYLMSQGKWVDKRRH